MLFNENAIKNKIQHYKMALKHFFLVLARKIDDTEERLDATSADSFPASDPPGHLSKSSEDRTSHVH